ncbi:hypothetical protein [Microlunatus endophyticus]|nr:hypothetical protein [Microlunatus endophyticus]
MYARRVRQHAEPGAVVADGQEAAMKIRTLGVIAAGAAIGYALNTESGRQKLAQLKDAGGRFLGRPDVQARTADLADKAKQRTGSLPQPVQNIANQTIDKAQQATSRAGSNGSAPGPA